MASMKRKHDEDAVSESESTAESDASFDNKRSGKAKARKEGSKRTSRKPKYEDMSPAEQAVWRSKKHKDKLGLALGMVEMLQGADGVEHQVIVANRTFFHFNTDPNSKRHLLHMMLLHNIFGEDFLVTDSMLTGVHSVSFDSCEYGIEPVSSQLRSRQHICIDCCHVTIPTHEAELELLRLVDSCLRETFPTIPLLDAETHTTAQRIAHIREHATFSALLSQEQITAITGSIIRRNRQVTGVVVSPPRPTPKKLNKTKSKKSLSPKMKKNVQVAEREGEADLSLTDTLPSTAREFDEAPRFLSQPSHGYSHPHSTLFPNMSAPTDSSPFSPQHHLTHQHSAPQASSAAAAASDLFEHVHPESRQADLHAYIQIMSEFAAWTASQLEPEPDLAQMLAQNDEAAAAAAPPPSMPTLTTDLQAAHMDMQQQLSIPSQEVLDHLLDTTDASLWSTLVTDLNLSPITRPEAAAQMLPSMHRFA